MSEPDDKSRSERLLSKDALPQVKVPHRDSEPVRKFRMPSKVGKEPHTGIDDGAADSTKAADKEASSRPTGKASRRRRRRSTGRFRDRTLDWFRTGDALAEEEELDGDYEPHGRSRAPLIAALVAGAIVLIGVVTWLLS